MSKQEPIAHITGFYQGHCVIEPTDRATVLPVGMALYRAPSQCDLTCVCGAVWEGDQMVHAPRKREWVGLTDEEFKFIASKYSLSTQTGMEYFKDELEAKLKEKNT